jgi:hypothetical protein
MTTTPTKSWLIAGAISAMIALAGSRIVAAGPQAKAADAPAAQAKAADGWGSVKGRFVYDGAAPAPVKLNVGGQPFCGQFPLVSEDLVVAKNGGIANVVIWVRGKVKMNPKFAATATDKEVLDNLNCRFAPHVIGLRVGQTLVIKNSDQVAYVTKIDGVSTQATWLIPANTSVDQAIIGPENLPASLSDSIHPWKHGWMLVRPNPYFAISDTQGNFEIKDLPAGEWEFQLWQEKSGYITGATVGGQKLNWLKGRVKWSIADDKTTDMGDIKITAAQFSK